MLDLTTMLICTLQKPTLFLHRSETLCQADTEVKSFDHHQCCQSLLPCWTCQQRQSWQSTGSMSALHSLSVMLLYLLCTSITAVTRIICAYRYW